MKVIIMQEGNKKKILMTNIPVSKCLLSLLNTRQDATEGVIERLAERIKKDGFDVSRALWGIKAKNKFSIFAGGLRLRAAAKAGVDVAVLEYVGFSEDEIVNLSDKDNIDDEFHTPVPIIDVWASYARLRDMGWTQERIGKAKGVDQATVSWRLRLHNESTDKMKDAVCNVVGFEERHLREIFRLCLEAYLESWLTTDEIRNEMVDDTVTAIKKNGKKSFRSLKNDIDDVKEIINKADEFCNSFESPKKEEFLQLLADNNVRTLTDIEYYAEQLKEGNGETDESTLATLKEKFLNEDGLELVEKLENNSIKLLLTDPPYGMDYQSNRRWVSEKRKKIKGDIEEEALVLISVLLEKIKPKLMNNAHLLIFTGSNLLCQLRQLILIMGYTLKGELIWVKEEHGAGDLKGSFAPRHEYIIHAVLGKPEISPRKSTVFSVRREHGANPKLHPVEKPVALLGELIESTTNKGELVIDPFAGVASTLVAACKLERKYWGCEIDKEYWDEGISRLEELLNDRV